MVASASIQATAIAPLLVPSESRANALTFNGFTLSGSNLSAMCLVIGTSATAPATFGALASPIEILMPGGLATMSIDTSNHFGGRQSGVGLAGMTIGDPVWFCYIGSTSTPISGTAITASVNCGVLAA